MGPTLLFDKSFLQSLNVDEATILDQLFTCVVTPLFFAETLGSLAKTSQGQKQPEAIVASLAEKTPVVHSYMNSFHSRLMFNELLGMHVEMSRRPAVAGGVPVTVEGKAGIVYDKSPEMEAFERWQIGRFSDVERIVAGAWRKQLGTIDLPAIANAFKVMVRKEARPKTHDQAKSLAQAIVDAPGQSYKGLVLAYGLLGFPPEALGDVMKVWKSRGRRSLSEFAPYTAHCLLIDLYFYLALSNGLISDQRASNKIDIGYLYYLPFVQMFVSGDRLHRTAAELFIGQKQSFVWAPDLKADLSRLNALYLAFPEKEKARGLFTLVTQPPTDDTGLVARLWDSARPRWREPKPVSPELTKEQSDEIVQSGKRYIKTAEGSVSDQYPKNFPEHENLDALIIQRHIPRTRGSWRIFSDEVERQEDDRAD